MDATVARFSRDFASSVDQATVRAVAEGSFDRYEDAPVRDFVPLLVERTAKHELRERVAAGHAHT